MRRGAARQGGWHGKTIGSEGDGEKEEVESQVMGSTFRYVTFPFSSSASILQSSRPPFPTHPTQSRLHPAFGVSVFVGSILQRPPTLFLLLVSLFSTTSYSFVPRVRVFPRVAPYFSCFAAASRSTFIQYRYVLVGLAGRANDPRGCDVCASFEKVVAPLAEVSFSFDSLPSSSRSVAAAAPRLAKCRTGPPRLAEARGAIRADSAPLRGERTIAAIK